MFQPAIRAVGAEYVVTDLRSSRFGGTYACTLHRGTYDECVAYLTTQRTEER